MEKKRNTKVSFNGTRVYINGRPTYENNRYIEGLLYNVRTVNATFDDTLGKADFWDDDGTHPENGFAGYGKWISPESAEANTKRFIEALPQYKDHGILAVNLCFQGGHPIQAKTWIPGARISANKNPNGQRDLFHNSGFNSDGTIDKNFEKRIASVIEACDRLGMVVILCLFYFGQDTVFQTENAIRNAVDNAVDFICKNGYTNVLLEIANEVMEWHYHHDILKPRKVSELIIQARQRARSLHGCDLPVSTSEAALLNRSEWPIEAVDEVYSNSDFILLHGGDNLDHGKAGDESEVAEKIDFITSRPWFRERPRPVIFNESDGSLAFDAALKRGVSFGLHSTPYIQTMWPPRWGVWENETLWFFQKVKNLVQTGNNVSG